MSATGVITLTVGIAIAKYMVSDWLGPGVAAQVAQDLLDLGRDQAREWSGGKQATEQLDRLAKQVVAEITPLWRNESRLLDAGAQTAVVLAVGRTITSTRIDAGVLVQHRLDAARLAATLADKRREQTAAFSDDECALYQRLLQETCQRIIQIGNHVAGYEPLVDRHTLLTLDQLIDYMGQILAGPVAADRAYEDEYRRVLPEQLDRFDTIGIAYAEDALRRQSLESAFTDVLLEADLPTDGSGRWEADTIDIEFAGFSERAEGSGLTVSRLGTIQAMLAQSSRLVIRGQPGSGKSTLLRWLAIRASRRQLAGEAMELSSWDDAVPFYLRLRTVRDGGIPKPRDWPQLHGLMLALDPPPTWVHELLKSGRALVLLDGMDEVAMHLRKGILEALQQLVKAYPLARYVITSRPAAIKNWPEWNEWTRAEGFLPVAMQDMGPEQVFAFINQWHEALVQGTADAAERAYLRTLPSALKQILRNRLPLRRLSRNPLLCTMICALHRDRPNSMPQDRVTLYQDCIEMLIHRRDAERSVGSMQDYPPLPAKQQELALREYAHHLLLNGVSEETAKEVDAYFDQLLESIHLPEWTGARLRDFFVQRTGLLIEPAEGQVAFAHRTFLEYLAAKVIVKKNEIPMLLGKASDDQWRETILLAVAIPEVSEEQSEKIFRGLLQRAEACYDPQLRKELYLLAVACMESPSYLPKALKQEVLAHAAIVIPPHSEEEAAVIAKAGDPAVQLLQFNEQWSDEEMAHSVEALAEIGSERALAAIVEYSTSTVYTANGAQQLRRAIGHALWHFDPAEYCGRVLSSATLFDLSYTQLSDAGLAHLAPAINLHGLFLGHTEVSDAGLKQLAAFTNLRWLNLGHTQISDAGLTRLAAHINLQGLDIGDTQVSDAGLAHLAALTKLKWLDLRDTQVSDAGLAHLAALTKLEWLYLSGTQVSDAGLAHLAALTKLEWLHLSNTQVSDAGLAHLVALTNLQRLYLIGTQVSDAGLAHLAALTNLQILGLSGTQVSDAGLAHLAALTNLQRLYLIGTQVSDAGLAHLAALTNLQILGLSGTQVSDAGLAHLAAFTNLQELDLRNTEAKDASALSHLTGLKVYME